MTDTEAKDQPATLLCAPLQEQGGQGEESECAILLASMRFSEFEVDVEPEAKTTCLWKAKTSGPSQVLLRLGNLPAAVEAVLFSKLSKIRVYKEMILTNFILGTITARVAAAR